MDNEQTWATDMSIESVDAMGTKSCKVIWKKFDLIEPEEVNMVLVDTRLATSILDSCSSCMVKNMIR